MKVRRVDFSPDEWLSGTLGMTSEGGIAPTTETLGHNVLSCQATIRTFWPFLIAAVKDNPASRTVLAPHTIKAVLYPLNPSLLAKVGQCGAFALARMSDPFGLFDFLVCHRSIHAYPVITHMHH
jgi:hypothetical protein